MSDFTNPFDEAGFASGTVTIPPPTNDPDVHVSIFYRHFVSASPEARPILLLHGHPQTHVIWSAVAPALAATGKWHVVVPDNRGNGASSAPSAKNDGERYSRYSKREMARDMVVLMSELGYETFHVVAHDRGARVAHRMALDWPAKPVRLILLDIAPTLDMYETTDYRFATAYWHWFFLLQPNAEAFITANPSAYLDSLVTRFPRSHPQAASPTAAIDAWRMSAYLANCTAPTHIAAMCEDYRASAPTNAPDLHLDRSDRQAGARIQCPTRVLWGKNGIIQAMYAGGLQLWQNCCEGEVRGSALECGHYIPEEAPHEVLHEVDAFFT
ncbi:hypothetical protein EX895_006570 [Sporisorium graminicola]|uniref:AB hydrolase-1 domain-containing protein n=1 Tax=Sporisorium graminicola TaxID=280036 RepID=A0A4U7KNM0_9BASI|nr:hypothetical protein EX895_006570 [Sporisorium graminicola]TKY84668.1 hypothetical protein EX895_006570 [Sporisorium graminicola]